MSKAKNKGIKRGTPQHKARQFDLVTRKEMDVRFERNVGQCINDQEICIALGRMGFRPGEFFELQETLVAVRKEYAEEFLEGSKVDKTLEYEKDRFDREFNQYTPECMHRSWEERNDLNRHTLGLRVGPAENRPEEMEAYIKEYSAWKAKNIVRAHKAAQTRARKKAAGATSSTASGGTTPHPSAELTPSPEGEGKESVSERIKAGKGLEPIKEHTGSEHGTRERN